MQDDPALHLEEPALAGDGPAAFAGDDRDLTLADGSGGDIVDGFALAGDDDLPPAETATDPRLAEMHAALEVLRDSEVSHALRELRQLFPHIPFPFRVRALMAVRHGLGAI